MMHNLSEMMVIPDSAGDARLSWRYGTQLEMPAECACMRTRHTPNTVYIRARMYLYLRIQASSNQYISTTLVVFVPAS